MLIVGCFLVLQPFLTAVVWAAILCATSWPLYERYRTRLPASRVARGVDHARAASRSLLFAPFVIVGATIADNADAVEHWARDCIDTGPPDPPAWVAGPAADRAERRRAYWAGMAHDTAAVIAELQQIHRAARKLALASGIIGRRVRSSAARAVDPDRVLHLSRRPMRSRDACAAASAARRRSRRPSRAGRDRDGARRRARHPRHRDRAGRACRHRLLDRGRQGGAAARLRHVRAVAGARSVRRSCGFRRACALINNGRRPDGASSCCCGVRSSCRRSTTSSGR